MQYCGLSPGFQSRGRCGRGAESRVKCPRGEPSPGADVGGVSLVPGQMWQGCNPAKRLKASGGMCRRVRLLPRTRTHARVGLRTATRCAVMQHVVCAATLTLDRNRLQSLPAVLAALPSLTALSVAANPLQARGPAAAVPTSSRCSRCSQSLTGAAQPQFGRVPGSPVPRRANVSVCLLM